MPEPSQPPTVAGVLLPLGAMPSLLQPNNYRIKTSDNTEVEFTYIPPCSIGSYVNFPFLVNSEVWIDPVSGLAYFQLCGKTIGSSFSNANYSDDRLRSLFINLHSNAGLELLDTEQNIVTRTGAMADWIGNRQLKLPFSQDKQKFIYTGCLGF